MKSTNGGVSSSASFVGTRENAAVEPRPRTQTSESPSVSERGPRRVNSSAHRYGKKGAWNLYVNCKLKERLNPLTVNRDPLLRLKAGFLSDSDV